MFTLSDEDIIVRKQAKLSYRHVPHPFFNKYRNKVMLVKKYMIAI
jgi:hypothetical protein